MGQSTSHLIKQYQQHLFSHTWLTQLRDTYPPYHQIWPPSTTVSSAVNTSAIISHHLLWIRRRPGTSRHVVNDADMLSIARDLLPHTSFHIYDDSQKKTLRKSAHLFHVVDMVIAPHGAGLTNLLFSRPGTLVIEIMPTPFKPITYFYQTTQVWGSEHHLLLAANREYNSLIISPERFRQALVTFIHRGAQQRQQLIHTLYDKWKDPNITRHCNTTRSTIKYTNPNTHLTGK